MEQLIRWQFQNLIVPMVAIAGRLYTTTFVLAKALGVDVNSVLHTYYRNKNRLTKLSWTDCPAKDVFAENKELFGIQRLREDLHIWTEAQMIFIAFNTNSAQGEAFSDAVIQLVQEQATKTMYTQEQLDETVSQLVTHYETELADMKARMQAFENSLPALRQMASNAGRNLAAQKFTKDVRN